jgi:hypothetical protein
MISGFSGIIFNLKLISEIKKGKYNRTQSRPINSCRRSPWRPLPNAANLVPFR